MVIAKTLVKVAGVMSLLFLLSLVWFISQMAAPLFSYILSFLAIILAVLIPSIIKLRVARAVLMLLFAVIINANYLFYALTAGSIINALIYGGGLLIVTWVMLFLLSEIMASLSPRHRHNNKDVL